MEISTIRFEPDFKLGLFKKYNSYYRGEEYGQGYHNENCDEDWVHLVVDDVFMIRDKYFSSVYTLEEIRSSLLEPGRYLIFNCSCFVPECGGWDDYGLTVHHTDTYIEWSAPERRLAYRFAREQYKAALDDLDKSFEPILAYDAWALAPENSGDPVTWAISTNQNKILSTLLEGKTIAAGAEYEPEHYSSFETYSAYATEVGNDVAAKLIDAKAKSLAKEAIGFFGEYF